MSFIDNKAKAELAREKQSLRKATKEKLKGLSRKKLREENKIIEKKLSNLTLYRQAKIIMFYWSLPGEVDTKNLIRKAKEENKIVALPVIVDKENIQPYEFISQERLVRSSLGFFQPDKKFSHPLKIEELDIVMVPGLAFDKNNRRLGRGRGYYDRFLKRLKPQTYKIGLAFKAQLVESLPFNSLQDEKVDLVISAE